MDASQLRHRFAWVFSLGMLLFVTSAFAEVDNASGTVRASGDAGVATGGAQDNPGRYDGVVFPYEQDPDFLEMEEDVVAGYDLADRYWEGAMPAAFGLEWVPATGLYSYDYPGEMTCGGRPVETGNALYCSADDFVAFDRGLLLYFMKNGPGDTSVYFTVFHEMGHNAQAHYAEPGTYYTITGELQADCFAGATMQDLVDVGALILEPGDHQELVEAFTLLGDRPGTPWFDSNAHGSAQDRAAAFLHGASTDVVSCASQYPLVPQKAGSQNHRYANHP